LAARLEEQDESGQKWKQEEGGFENEKRMGSAGELRIGAVVQSCGRRCEEKYQSISGDEGEDKADAYADAPDRGRWGERRHGGGQCGSAGYNHG
jgi:hypothetical protein